MFDNDMPKMPERVLPLEYSEYFNRLHDKIWPILTAWEYPKEQGYTRREAAEALYELLCDIDHEIESFVYDDYSKYDE